MTGTTDPAKALRGKKVYTAEATVDAAGREGHVRTPDGSLDLTLVIPPELGGPGGEGTNPEELFAAGYAACFTSALGGFARRAGASMEGASLTARVHTFKGRDGFHLGVELVADLPAVDPELARSLLEQAHQRCPYSRATRGNIDVELKLATD